MHDVDAAEGLSAVPPVVTPDEWPSATRALDAQEEGCE